MASRRTNPQTSETPRRRRATTPEARENQLIALAIDEAERQMREGTASSQVITHYLKLGSSREKLEQRKIELEGELLVAKKEAMASASRVEELFTSAISAFRSYSGDAPLELGDDDDYDHDDY